MAYITYMNTMKNTMKTYEVTINLTDGSSFDVVWEYGAHLSMAQVSAALRRRCLTTHGRRFAGLELNEV